jgi:carboxyl-terminal processing protease
MIDLDRVAKNKKPQFGELKMTIAQFFRINGGTTQLRGVTPDIPFPEISDPDHFGESSFDNALPWTQIKPADYTPAGDVKGVLPILLTLHQARVKKDRDFRYLEEDIAESRLEHKKNLVSLNEAERRKERDAQEARVASRESRADAGKGAKAAALGGAPAQAMAYAPPDDGLQVNERNLTKELAAEKAQKNAKDVLLNEAVHILSDEVAVLKNDSRLAARVMPRSALMAD